MSNQTIQLLAYAFFASPFIVMIVTPFSIGLAAFLLLIVAMAGFLVGMPWYVLFAVGGMVVGPFFRPRGTL